MDPVSLRARGVDPGALRRMLRSATVEVHAALDERFAGLGWDSAFAYHAFVRMNDACHRVLEPWLDPHLDPHEHGLRRQFSEPLMRDMDAMRLAQLPAPALPFETTADVAEAAGVVYVLDGSRLGARVIARQLEKDPSAAHLSLEYVRAAATPGPVFAALDRLASRLEESDIGRTIEAASRTFALFGTTCEYATRR